MNKNWQTKKLGDVCKVIAGQSPDGKFYNKAGEGVPFYQGKKDFTEKYIGEPSVWTTEITKEADEGDILMSVRAPVGPVNFATKRICIGRGLAAIRSGKDIDKDFLFYFLQSFEKEIVGNSGAVFNSINKRQIENIKILLPSLFEQKRIVKTLDEIFEKLEKAKVNTEINIDNSKKVLELYLSNELRKAQKCGYEKLLGDVCEQVEYGSSSKSKPDGKVPVLRMGNIQNGRFDWNKLVYSDNDDEIKKYSLKYNDVLFNRTNSPELVGKTAIYKGEMSAIFAGYLIRIHRNKKLLDADYLNYFLNSQMAVDYGRTVFISSVNQANINGQKLKGYPIPVPPISDQKAIVIKLDQLSSQTKKLESIYQKKLADIEELKKSVLSKAFSGEL
ncbi:MAG: restriction endonuclease subunit S [Candidatus Paceibacterota bacterium]|jgi:type I restriction enzyme S subunit